MGSLLESSPGIVSNALHFVNLGTWRSLILTLLKIWWQGPSMADRSCQQKCAVVAEELMAQSATNHKVKVFFGHLFHAPPKSGHGVQYMSLERCFLQTWRGPFPDAQAGMFGRSLSAKRGSSAGF